MTNYLKRREGRYSYRRRYPSEIAAILGRTEFVQALGTADPAEAARLVHRVSVQFDDKCAEAIAKAAESASAAPKEKNDISGPDSHSESAVAVLALLPGVMRTITLSLIAEQGNNPRGWRNDAAWRKQALLAHANGEMPNQIQMHPALALAALRALERVEAGQPMDAPEKPPEPQLKQLASETALPNTTLSDQKLEAAFSEYEQGKTLRRVQMARRCAARCIRTPCTQTEALTSITSWCSSELKRNKTPNAVWTEISAVIALLKLVPGWHGFNLPKTGEIRALKGAGRARKDARVPMPVPVLRDVMSGISKHLPRGGGHWQAALLLCSLYGCRPGELLQSGVESLVERTDIMGNTQLVFRIGLNGAKNESSKRDVPVPEHLEPVFRLALRQGACIAETTRTRVQRLNQLVRRTLGSNHKEISLYSVRHTFSDVARDCGYSNMDFGALMGHTSKGGITGIYGGKESLDRAAEILAAIQKKLYPEGLAEYLPATL